MYAFEYQPELFQMVAVEVVVVIFFPFYVNETPVSETQKLN